jgi:hypothetical protein
MPCREAHRGITSRSVVEPVEGRRGNLENRGSAGKLRDSLPCGRGAFPFHGNRSHATTMRAYRGNSRCWRLSSTSRSEPGTIRMSVGRCCVEGSTARVRRAMVRESPAIAWYSSLSCSDLAPRSKPMRVANVVTV